MTATPIAACPSCTREQEVRITGRRILPGERCDHCSARMDAAKVRFERAPATPLGASDELLVALLEATNWREVPREVLARIAAVVQEEMQ